MSDLQLLLARNGVRIGLHHHCGQCETPDDVAKHFGLRTGNEWHALNRSAAMTILQALLERDLAYSDTADGTPIASGVAHDFIGEFPDGTRFYTNSDWQFGDGEIRIGSSGFSATYSTFDSGILALNAHKIGVYWVEDED